MRHPASVIPDARLFRRELESIYRIQLPQLDVPRGWLPRVERIVETLARHSLLRRTALLEVRQHAGAMYVAIDGPYSARILVQPIARAAASDCGVCGGPVIHVVDGERTRCLRCPRRHQRTGR
jgi:hypothetical protein